MALLPPRVALLLQHQPHLRHLICQDSTTSVSKFQVLTSLITLIDQRFPGWQVHLWSCEHHRSSWRSCHFLLSKVRSSSRILQSRWFVEIALSKSPIQWRNHLLEALAITLRQRVTTRLVLILRLSWAQHSRSTLQVLIVSNPFQCSSLMIHSRLKQSGTIASRWVISDIYMLGASDPTWAKVQHCGMGMVGSINAPTSGNNTHDAFVAAAKAIGANEATVSLKL